MDGIACAICRAFHTAQLLTASTPPAVVFDTGELPPLFPRLRVVRYEEPVAGADFGQIKVRLAPYCGERPE